MHQLVVFQTDLLVYEDCRLHHERKGMQLEKIPKCRVNNQGIQQFYIYNGRIRNSYIVFSTEVSLNEISTATKESVLSMKSYNWRAVPPYFFNIEAHAHTQACSVFTLHERERVVDYEEGLLHHSSASMIMSARESLSLLLTCSLVPRPFYLLPLAFISVHASRSLFRIVYMRIFQCTMYCA